MPSKRSPNRQRKIDERRQKIVHGECGKHQRAAQSFQIAGREIVSARYMLANSSEIARYVEPCRALQAMDRRYLLPGCKLPRDIREIRSGGGSKRVPGPWTRIHIQQFVSIIATIVFELDLNNSVVLQ